MKKFKITTGGDDYFVVPRKALKQLTAASAEQLKVLLYCAANGEFDRDTACRECGIDGDVFDAALEFWQKNKIIKASEKQTSHVRTDELLQTYDSETLSDAIEKEPDFSSIKNFVEDLLGKVLNRNDVSLLYNMYHFAGMNADYICTVAAYAAGRGKQSILYITRTAFDFYDNGADTFEKLEAMIAERQSHDADRNRLISLCGLGSRQLSQKENAFITRWFSEFEIPFEVVKIAYDKMVDTIGKVNLTYLDAILTDWHANGIRDEKGAKEAASQRKTELPLPEDSFDAGEFVKAAMKKGVK